LQHPQYRVLHFVCEITESILLCSNIAESAENQDGFPLSRE